MDRYADIFKKVYVRFLFALISFSLILMSACPNRVWAYEELTAVPGTTLTIPLTLNEEKIIESFDILILGYDPAVLELTDITLAGGILEPSNYVLTDSVADNIFVSIYTSESLATGSGDIAFMSFDVKDNGMSMLSLVTFSCNEIPVAGGFYANGTISGAVKISVSETEELETDEDAALGGTRSAGDGSIAGEYESSEYDPLMYDLNKSGRLGIEDAVYALREGDLENAVRILQWAVGLGIGR